MFPIRDHNPSGSTPYVTRALIVVNILVFLAYVLTVRDDYHRALFFFNWGVVPKRVLAGQGDVTLLTHMFLHGGWLHLAGNMLFLWIFGDNLEDQMGPLRYLLFYIACGMAAAALQIAGDPTAPQPMVGASGAIAGVLGGYLLLYPKARIDVVFVFLIFFRVFAVPAWIVLGIWFGVQLFNSAASAQDGVAYLAHVGGFVAGVVLTVPGWIKRGGNDYWQKNQGRPPHPDVESGLSKSNVPRVGRR